LRRQRVPIAAVVVLVLALPAGLSAAVRRPDAGPQPIYAAFSLIQQGKLATKRCGGYLVTAGTYSGRSASPDPRLAGGVTYTGWVAFLPGGTTGVVRGTLTIRDGSRTLRMRSTVVGVITERAAVNGFVSGTLVGPAARILANVTMVFDDELSFAAVRLGFETGKNSAIAYPAVPKCF
jgi:hypothetical protein